MIFLKLLLASTLATVPVETLNQPVAEMEASFDQAEANMKERPRLTVEWPNHVFLPSDLPPPKYQGLTRVQTKVLFVRDPDTMEGCGAHGSLGVLACTTRGDPVIIVPNPCQYPEENYARLLCHELGHVRGWRH